MPKTKSTRKSVEVSFANIPKEGQIAVVHGLRNQEMSIRKIANALGMAKSTVERYLEIEPNPEWDDLRTAIEEALQMKMVEISAKTLALEEAVVDRLKEETVKAKFDDLMRLFESLKQKREESAPSGVVVPVQVNFNDVRKKYE